MFQRRLQSIQANQENLSLHSLRAGGVTLAAQNNVPRHLYKQHGRWQSEAVDAYVTSSVKDKLSVTDSLNH